MSLPPHSHKQRMLYTVDEACHLLSIGRTSLYALMSSGQLDYVKIGRSRRIPTSALTQLAGFSPE